MARRIAATTLNATTLDILNVIRQNASYDYQQNVPEVTQATDIPKVGEVIYGTPAFANQFINALVNRIAIVRVQSATFNNPYAILKKGYLEYGESIEDIFVNIAKVVDYTPEKGAAREFKRTLPDVRSAFHVMNWRVLYPVSIEDEDLRQAFLSLDGVTNLITKIVDSVYVAAEYDEFLLFKYLIIKGVAQGKFYPRSIGTGTDLKVAAKQFRGISNLLPFMRSDFNEAGVKTTTPKDRQIIFMDAMFNADFDVEVLASAFNMDKADFMGRLFLIDDFTTFDNERFEVIRENSDGLEEVTQAELNIMADVKAIIVDENWFQVYDNMNKFTEKYSAAGLYWNYFYHQWKTISSSPFANAIVFATDNMFIEPPETISATVASKDESNEATVFTLNVTGDTNMHGYEFIQTEAATTAGVAIQKYGAITIPYTAESVTPVIRLGGQDYTAGTAITAATEVGTTINFTI